MSNVICKTAPTDSTKLDKSVRSFYMYLVHYRYGECDLYKTYVCLLSTYIM